jgi:quercetin dioxygenase-like cupin family protein
MRMMVVRASLACVVALLPVAQPAPAAGAARQHVASRYTVIRTGEFVTSVNPHPNERVRVDILTTKEHANNINGILGSIPPRLPDAKPVYHHHQARESLIQILSGDATEMIEGTPVPLHPGDVVFIPPTTQHTLMNNSSTTDVKYMEFFSPIAADTVPGHD